MVLEDVIAPEGVTLLKHGTKLAIKLISKISCCKLPSYMFPRGHCKRSIGRWYQVIVKMRVLESQYLSGNHGSYICLLYDFGKVN
jgi:hypothetical protein